MLTALAFGALGLFVGLRTGSGEAVQSLFPLMFVFLFLSSASLPRELIAVDWFRTVATWNPVSYVVEGLRSPLVEGWNGEALALGFGISAAFLLLALVGGHLRPAHEAGAHVSGRATVSSVALGVAWRYLTNIRKNPAFLLPPLVMPIFFLVAFAGGLSAVSEAPGFDYPDYTAFQFAFVLLQSAAFAGVFAGFTIAADFESGFARRLMLAAPRRSGIVLGYAMVSLGRAVLTGLLVGGLALAAGMEVNSGVVDVFGLIVLALLLNVTATMFTAGVALRLRAVSAAPLMQFPVFLILFLAPVYVPLDLLHGWIHAVARVNPATPMVEAARGFLAGDPVHVAAAFACVRRDAGAGRAVGGPRPALGRARGLTGAGGSPPASVVGLSPRPGRTRARRGSPAR